MVLNTTFGHYKGTVFIYNLVKALFTVYRTHVTQNIYHSEHIATRTHITQNTWLP